MNTTPLPLASRVFVKDWNELAKIPPSETHYLIISPEKGNGWVKKKGSTKPGTYLTTHTFYGSTFARSTRLLQSCGFNVQLANWSLILEPLIPLNPES